MPAIAASRVYMFDRVGDRARLTCLEAETGKEVWQVAYATDYVDSYEFSDGVSAALGVTNLLETSAPQMAQRGTSNNTEPGIYDLFGRSYRVSFAYRFGD